MTNSNTNLAVVSQTLSFEEAFKPVDVDDIKRRNPSIFSSEHLEGLSKSYVHITTGDIINKLAEYGWVPIHAHQLKTKRPNAELFAKHVIKFRNPKHIIGSKKAIDTLPELLLINSHDGKCSFKLAAGLYRVVCSNGLVVHSSSLAEVRLRHKGFTMEELEQSINEFNQLVPQVIDRVVQMKAVKLKPTQVKKFARQAVNIRWNESYEPKDMNELMTALRPEDEGNDLWKVYNRVQEKIVRGGFKGQAGRKVKSLKNYDRELQINRKLFELAETFIK